MKAYKIDLSMLDGEAREDVSAAIQRHAFRLGYAWLCGGEKTRYEYCPVLYFEADGKILKNEDTDGFNKWTNTEVSITDFLALKPEDVKEKPVPVFRPFDRVLVRDYDDETWRASFFSNIQGKIFQYKCASGCFNQCIPYEGNEHLLGTTEDAE